MSTPVVSLSPSASLYTAWQLMNAKRVRHIPILAQDELVGIISDRDIMQHAAKLEASKLVTDDANLQLAKLMNPRVLSAKETTKITIIAGILFAERIGCMPIINDADHLIGILTRSDILHAVMSEAPLALWT